MILTFKELGIKHISVFSRLATAEIVNTACDYIMEKIFPNQNEHDVIRDPRYAIVDYVNGTVKLYTELPTIH